MAREDILANVLRNLMLKENPPPPDEDNTLIQKLTAPNDKMHLSFEDPIFSKVTPGDEKWGGYVGETFVEPGWLWGQGAWN